MPPHPVAMVVTAGTAASNAAGAGLASGSALRDVEHAQDDLDALGAALRARLAELHALQDRFETAVNKQAKSIRAIADTRPAALEPARDAPSGADVAPHPSPPDPPPVAPDRPPPADAAPKPPVGAQADFASDVERLRERLTQMQLLMPRTGGFFVEMFLGSINVRFERKSERLAFKKEYEKLKMKLAPVFVFFAIICLIFEEYRWVHMILQLSLTSYYVALAIRENILRANGSNIRTWWVIHHYFTMMQGVLLLTWPNGISYARFRQRLHLFGLYNAVLMIFQTRYQMARLYTLRSLGRANEMDVASSDSMQIHWSETMRLLLPLIVFGQIMQAYQALTLFNIYREFPTELQILLLSILFSANFIGNSITTIKVLVAKRAASKRRSSDTSPSASNRIDSNLPPRNPSGPSQPLTREEAKKSS